MRGLRDLTGRLARLTLVVGKGGVGKTTLAAGLAARLATDGHRTLLLSTDPASALADAIGQSLGSTPHAIARHPGLDAMQLSAAAAREAFLARWRDTIVTIVDRGTYLDLDDIGPLVDAALPGADEVFALLELASLVRPPGAPGAPTGYDRIVVDTAPTGHTLRLLALPETFRGLVALLDAMQDKHRFMVRALTHRYASDRADEFIAEMRSSIEALHRVLTDASLGAAVLVARAEPLVVAESARYAAALAAAHVHVLAVVVNALPVRLQSSEADALAALVGVAPEAEHWTVPRAARPPVGLEEIVDVVGAMRARDATEERGTRSAAWRARRADEHLGVGTRQISTGRTRRASRVPRPVASLLPPPTSLTLIAGKGGVGKTTTSCALAIAAADEGRSVLLVSTDPAPSIADALAQPIVDAECEVSGAPGLVARQFDAGAAFVRFREGYQSRIDALFDGIVGRGMDVAVDRAILRDLLALAPPGIDELYALASLGETLASERFERIVVDPAPTGHLLRLLEMPAVALDWTHRLLRLMLKYKEIAGLGDTAQELLDFARRTRALDALLHDPGRGAVLIVAIDEPLVRAETSRLLASVRQLGIEIAGILWNRGDEQVRPLPSDPPVAQFAARATEPAPVGVAELRRWSAHWAALSPSHG